MPYLSDEQRTLLAQLIDSEEACPSASQIQKRHTSVGEAAISFAQERLWFLEQLAPGSSAYTVAVGLRLTGRLDQAALAASLEGLVQRHEALRTRLPTREGRPYAVVDPSGPLALAVVDLRAVPAELREAAARQEAAARAASPFDLAAGPLARAVLFRLGDTEHTLLLSFHHSVVDGWSAQILLRDLGALYQAACVQGEAGLPELAVQYGDFAAWQRGCLQGAERERQSAYWRGQLAGAPPVLALPTDRPRPGVQAFRGGQQRLALGAELTAALRARARSEGVTLFMLLLAGFQVLMGRLAGQEDVVVGSPMANRPHATLDEVVGCFVNTLALRTKFDAGETFRSLLGRVRETCLAAYAHQDVPFELVVEAAQVERSLSYTPVFQVMFALQPTVAADRVRLPGLAVEEWDVERRASQCDLMLTLTDGEQGLAGGLEYDSELFTGETIGRIAERLETLLGAIAADAEQRVGELPILPGWERARVVGEWNATGKEYPRGLTLDGLLGAQAARTPEAVAVTAEGGRLSYGELEERANRLAHYLRAQGVGAEARVGVCLERSLELMVALVGILKAGGAYVPLDPSYPRERLGYMLADAGARVLLTSSGLSERLPAEVERNNRLGPGGIPTEGGETACPTEHLVRLEMDRLGPELAGMPGTAPAPAARPGNLAYLIHTSGSTGTPKGVMITHEAICNRLLWMQESYRLMPEESVLQKTSISFDVSVWELFWPLMVGARVVLARPNGQQDPGYLVETMAAERITTVHFVPSMLAAFVAEEEVRRCEGLRRVICSGEALSKEVVKRFRARLPGVSLHNLYGPTEAAVDVTAWACPDDWEGETVPIGRAVANTQIYILDGWGEPVPVGVAGELHIGGIQVGRGYLGRPGMTAERFVPDGFSAGAGRRLYRTGDVARWGADGQVEYLGRGDQQVKIRGFRVELGEIEGELQRHGGVREAAVVARGGEDGGSGGGLRLVAYLVGWGREARPTQSELRRHLQQRLPEYMIPAAVVWLEALPLSPNGKLDRRKLPAPESERPTLDRAYAPPRTPTEASLVEIWSKVLGVQPIGIHDNFFELGGDSILSLSVIAMARKQGFCISLQSLFRLQTIASLAAAFPSHPEIPAKRVRSTPFELVTTSDRERLPPGIEDAYPISKLQAGMLYHMQLTPEAPNYHNVDSYFLRAHMDVGCLRAAAGTVVPRHPVLRTVFDLVSYSDPLQLVLASAEIEVESTDIRSLSQAEQEQAVLKYVDREVRRPFNLDQPPPLRLHVHIRTDDAFQLTITDFHPLLDGWSLHTVLAEIFENYFALLSGEGLPPRQLLTSTFRDFIASEREAIDSAACRSFWEEQLCDAPLLRLPRWERGARPAVAHGTVGRLSVPLKPEVTEGLRRVAREMALPLKSVMLAVHLRVLALVTGETDVTTGIVTHGRLEEEEGEHVCGLFLNTVPLRVRLAGGAWTGLIRATFAAESALLPFRRYPVLTLHAQEDRRTFDATFNYVSFHVMDNLLRSGRLESLGFSLGSEPTNLPLAATVYIYPGSEQIDLMLDYQKEEFGDEQIAAMAGYYVAAMSALVADPSSSYETARLMELEQSRLQAWSNTSHQAQPGECLHRLFEAQAARLPDAVAVVYRDEELTYRELDHCANRLARYLRLLGVGPDVVVGVCLDRSLHLVISLLGVLKAGGAYLPLDISTPEERLAFIFGDARIKVLLTREGLISPVPNAKWQTVFVDDASICSQSTDELPVNVTPENLACVIYTSGSTGLPKGVAIPHRSVPGFMCGIDYAQFDAGESMLQHSSISFDASTLELWPVLVHGGRAVHYPGTMLTPLDLEETIRQYGITTLYLSASFFNAVVDMNPRILAGVRQLLIGGEALSAPHVLRALECLPNTHFVNAYGPTEICVACCALRIPRSLRHGEWQSIPIGRPIGDRRVYVLDPWLQPVPVGTPGELCVGGPAVARGYLGRPGMTAERFVPDPFSAEPGARLYRTGDLTRWRADGQVEYLGRRDQQVKVRGFRVELGEIETEMRRHPGVGDAAVVAREMADGAGLRLVAYLVAAGVGPKPALSELRRYLQERLPDYMIPAAIVWLEALPLTPNGKLDRRALPAPDLERPALDHQYAPPQTPAEALLADIWSKVLGVEPIGIHDNFFGLGGDSIRSLQIVARATQAGLRLSPRQLFQHQTIAELAGVSSSVEITTARTAAVEPAGVTREVPLTPIQHWFLEAPGPEPHHWNQAVRVEVREPLRQEPLQAAIDRLIEQHDALRLRFERQEAGWKQVVIPAATGSLAWMDLSGITAAEQEKAVAEAEDSLQASLNLAQGPLLRVAYCAMGPAQPDQLLMVIHHLAVDLVSWPILLEDLETAYRQLASGVKLEAVELARPGTSFAAWAAAMQESAASPAVEAEMGYWGSHGEKFPSLPRDIEAVGTVEEGGARMVQVSLDAETTRALVQDVPAASLSQVQEVLLTALAQVLLEWTGEARVAIDVEGHGREEIRADLDVSRTVGWFTTLYPLRVTGQEMSEPSNLLKTVKEQFRSVPRHGMGYGQLRYQRSQTGGEAVAASGEISFNYLGVRDEKRGSGLFGAMQLGGGRARSARAPRRHLLNVGAQILNGELDVWWTYSPEVHAAGTIEKLAAGFIIALRGLIASALNPRADTYVPSDFPLAGLDQDELDCLISDVREMRARGLG